MARHKKDIDTMTNIVSWSKNSGEKITLNYGYIVIKRDEEQGY